MALPPVRWASETELSSPSRMTSKRCRLLWMKTEDPELVDARRAKAVAAVFLGQLLASGCGGKAVDVSSRTDLHPPTFSPASDSSPAAYLQQTPVETSEISTYRRKPKRRFSREFANRAETRPHDTNLFSPEAAGGK